MLSRRPTRQPSKPLLSRKRWETAVSWSRKVTDLETTRRALLQFEEAAAAHDEPAAEEPVEIVVEAAEWAAEFEPPVLSVEQHAAAPTTEEATHASAEPVVTATAAAPDVEPPAVAIASVVTPPAPAPVQAAPPQPQIEEPVEDDADFDPEVAAIFAEEATELLEAADHSLSAWIRDRGNNALVFELKRVVHTLKGGARMAGIASTSTATPTTGCPTEPSGPPSSSRSSWGRQVTIAAVSVAP